MNRARRISTAVVHAFALLIASAGCDRGDDQAAVTRQNPYVPVDSGTVRIVTATDTFSLSVEIAETAEARSFGLMEREELPENEGMVFLHSEIGHGAFYMFHTRIPLSIAFFDQDGRIVSILEMSPCTDPVADRCERYSPAAPYIGALEASQGYFANHGIQVGDRIELLRR